MFWNNNNNSNNKIKFIKKVNKTFNNRYLFMSHKINNSFNILYQK